MKKKKKHIGTQHGAIESVDADARTITLVSPPETQEVLTLDADAKVMKGTQEMPLESLDVGAKLSAVVSEKRGEEPQTTSVRIVEE